MSQTQKTKLFIALTTCFLLASCVQPTFKSQRSNPSLTGTSATPLYAAKLKKIREKAISNVGNEALVSDNEAVFTFPINPQKQYEWCSGGLQYAWNVSAQNGNDTFEFGFSLFTPMGATPCGKGNFLDLLREGEFGIWKVNKGKAKKGSDFFVQGLKVEHTVDSYGRLLSIILKDKKAIDLIFSKKPKYVTFQSQVLERKSSKKIPVIYRER